MYFLIYIDFYLAILERLDEVLTLTNYCVMKELYHGNLFMPIVRDIFLVKIWLIRFL